MALEDRCSPQNAPSPPGIPHSPQSTSSPIILDMSIHQSHLHHNPIHPLMSSNTFEYILPQQYEQLKQLHQANVISHFDQKMSRLSPTSPSNLLDSTIAPTIKEEENDSIMDEDDEHIDVDDQIPAHHIQSKSPLPQLPRISFSITNILSDRYGRLHPGTHEPKPNTNSENKLQTLSSPSIFRPFEINRNVNSDIPERSAFTRLTTRGDILEYSRAQQQAAAAAAAAVMMAERANFLNCFNPVAYPRIHEEILNNSTRKFKQQQQSQILPPPSAPAGLSSPSNEKIQPLGSLCKTVSQIGQSFMSSPPPASVCSSFSTSSSSASSTTSASPLCRLPNNSPQPIPPQSVSRDSGMESSDDTRSETSSTKDENGQLWPAWVYCTRYSDRPSSGPRYRRPKKPKDPKAPTPVDDKRPRTAFSSDQLARLKREFNENRYLTERRRQQLSSELGLNEAQIKIWFQNKRAKIKKSSGTKNPLALQLMAQGLYNHTTVPLTKEEEELEMRMNGQF